MSEEAVSNTQEEYEDDFEKDLDWLISEESRSEEQVCKEEVSEKEDEEDQEAQRDQELEEEEEQKKGADEEWNEFNADENGEDERWPTPMDPADGLFEDHKDEDNVEDEDEDKTSILQKIEQANRQLQDQEAPDETRHRRLHFKDTLVDLVVPAGDYPSIPGESEAVDNSAEVSAHMQKLTISSQDGSHAPDGHTEGAREGRVLVEKDGKFDLVSLKEVESQRLLPPLPVSHTEGQQEPTRGAPSPPKLHSSSATTCAEPRYLPKPPPRPRARPNSASHTQRERPGSKRRVQSAGDVPSHATFFLSPQQKELLTKQQLKKERLAREEEERRRAEEEQKRQENEAAFRMWLFKKRQQLRDERRLQRAQGTQTMSSKRESDTQEAVQLWLQRKQEQQLRERQLEEMRRLELQGSVYLHRPEENHKAFRLWLRRKRLEKRLEQQAARERSRRLLMEARRARRMRDIFFPVNDVQSLRVNALYTLRS